MRPNERASGQRKKKKKKMERSGEWPSKGDRHVVSFSSCAFGNERVLRRLDVIQTYCTDLSPADHLHGSPKVPQCFLVVFKVLQRDCTMKVAFEQL